LASFTEVLESVDDRGSLAETLGAGRDSGSGKGGLTTSAPDLAWGLGFGLGFATDFCFSKAGFGLG
jgi:hypothetical protein